MSFWLQILGAYVATVSAGLTVEIPRALLFKVGYVGAFGYIMYLCVLPSSNVVVATLAAGIVIAGFAQLFARYFKAPVTMFYIPGFFPLVPGIGIYRTAFYYINQQPEQASHYFLQTLLVSGAIAVSIFLMDSLLEIFAHLHKKRKETSHG
ncbi:MAG: threonine/serine exporter family protein [Aerococcaceae bacterium]|nr:threonine/serine exporter family protein [Aerococcaceae bacterium]